MLCQECSLPTFRSKGRTRLHWFLSSYNPGPLYLENVLMKRKVFIGGKFTGIAFGRHGKPVTLNEIARTWIVKRHKPFTHIRLHTRASELDHTT